MHPLEQELRNLGQRFIEAGYGRVGGILLGIFTLILANDEEALKELAEMVKQQMFYHLSRHHQ